MWRSVASGTSAKTSWRATPLPQSMTYAALFLMMTWADAELAFRGRGPPPVPSKMSLVRVVWLWVLYGCENAATTVAVPVRNARRLQTGMCRPEKESYLAFSTLGEGRQPESGMASPTRLGKTDAVGGLIRRAA
jgi:hypothetical protein